MEPHKEIVNAAVGDLGLGPVGPQEAEPVLRGDHIVGVCGVLCEVQGIQELLPLLKGQGMDILPDHQGFPVIAVRAGPPKPAESTVVAIKMSWFILKRKRRDRRGSQLM